MVRPLNNDRTVSASDSASPGFGAVMAEPSLEIVHQDVLTTTSAVPKILEICFTMDRTPF
jgi:hypothetical protein